MNSEGMPKQIVIERTEEIRVRERGKPWKRWNEEVVGSEDNGNNNLAFIGQRPEGMEKNCIRSQGSQRTVVLEKGEWEKKEEEKQEKEEEEEEEEEEKEEEDKEEEEEKEEEEDRRKRKMRKRRKKIKRKKRKRKGGRAGEGRRRG
jgi:TATA-binding protein-associated factor Taf7